MQRVGNSRVEKSRPKINAMAREHLQEDELRSLPDELPGWSVERDKLHREYRFADFAQAIGFMMMAAIRVEKMNHHPEWFNVYNRVTIDLTTHDAGGITAKDVQLARVLDGIASLFI